GEIGNPAGYVELDELGALIDLLAAVDQHLRDDARDLARHVDALRCDQRADGGKPLDPLLGARRLGRYRRGRRLHLRQERADHLRLEDELEVAEAAEKRSKHHSGNDETSAHCAFPMTSRSRFNMSTPCESRAARGSRELD